MEIKKEEKIELRLTIAESRILGVCLSKSELQDPENISFKDELIRSIQAALK